MQRVADYIFQHLHATGTRHVFLLTGGGAMFLNDALGHCEGIRYVCCHHEQACAMAAEAYARVSGRVGVVSVTTGPGGINALNGVFGAFTDSIPMLVISGQVKRQTTLTAHDVPGLRQLGDQEVDIVRMAAGITKYAVQVTEPESIRYHLERALHLATSGRPGPCWLDIPVDVQSAMVDPASMRGYDPAEDAPPATDDLASRCAEVIERLAAAERPVLMIGSGVRIADAVPVMDRVRRRLGIPVVTSWTGHDMVPSDDPQYCGRPGTIGNRAGNFTVQNSDVLLVVGSRLNVRQVSYNWENFARHAYKVWVDVDPAELQKPTVRPDLPIVSDARLFFEELERQLHRAWVPSTTHAAWLAWCRERVERYPVVAAHHRATGGALNPYHFLDALIRRLDERHVIACGDGAACVIPFQVGHMKPGMRMFCNSGDASMGYDIPSAIGAAFAAPDRTVICLAGDGSGQLNIQELQTIAHHALPIKLFILNNGGYLSIRMTQGGFFKGNFVGESARSGVSFPDYVKVGTAYGLPSFRIEGPDAMDAVDAVLRLEGPALCEVMLDPDQLFEPKLSSRQLPDGRIVSASLEDMAPFLDRTELEANMLVALTF